MGVSSKGVVVFPVVNLGRGCYSLVGFLKET